MKVVRKDPGEKPRIISLENTLSALQKAVGGYIETVTFCSNAAIVCNEEGRLLGMAHNCRVLGIDFVGTILVVGVEGWNEDGQTLADSLNLQFTDYTQAVEEILAYETVANLLAEDAVLEITVVGPENAQCTRLLAGVKACTAGQGNARCHAARPEEAEAAHEMGLSCGKYRAYQELLALDPTVTPEEVAGMTMAEIRTAIRQLQGAETGVPATPGGHGHGHRHGWE